MSTTCEARNPDWVALGRYRPRAPTDLYVRALAHTVPRITDSLRDRRLNERCARRPADSAGQDVQTRSTSSSVRDCGGLAICASAFDYMVEALERSPITRDTVVRVMSAYLLTQLLLLNADRLVPV
jgi:hypothetical protein